MKKSFDEKLALMHARLASMHAAADKVASSPGDRSRAIEELEEALAELQVAEEELRQQNEELIAGRTDLESERYRYRDLFDSAPDAYLVTDAAGIDREANRAAAELLGVDTNFLVGKPLVIFIDDGLRNSLHKEIKEIIKAPGPSQHALRMRARKGRVFDAAVTAAPMRDVSGRASGIRWIVRDDTERRKSEEEIKRLNAELQKRISDQSSQLQTARGPRDYFLAMVSHELRTPLTPVLAAASELEKRTDLPTDVHNDLSLIRRNATLEARLIDDLLDLTRFAWGKLRLELRTLDVHAVLADAFSNCEAEARDKQQHVNIEMGAEEHFVNGDPMRLQQVFWNIIRNAIKFTPEGGNITIRTSNPRDGAVRVEVIDTGIGITSEALSRIFMAFEQEERSLKERSGGLGLGLSISKALVEGHGGMISARSEGKGRGTTFSVELPTVPAETIPAPAAPAAGDEQVARGRRILLVEDHPDTARLMARLLSQHGYSVRTAGTVAAALHLAGSEEFDLVISDIGLPDGSGLDVMNEVRKTKPIRGIALTGFGAETDVERSKQAGFAAHVTKPIDLNQLRMEIERVMG